MNKLNKALFLIFSLLALVQTTSLAANTTPTRAFGSGKYALELDNFFVGWIDSVEGGDAVGEVVIDKETGKKNIGNVKYRDISFKMGTDMAPAFWNWVSGAMNQKGERKNGAIIAADFNYKELSRREFTEGLISEISFPKLDANSKDGAMMTLRFSIKESKRIVGSGKILSHTPRKDVDNLLYGFVVNIDGLEDATARISTLRRMHFVAPIEATIEENTPRTSFKEPGKIDFPNLGVELSESDANSFFTWHEDFVIKGTGKTGQGKSGSLIYLNRNRQKEFSLEISNLGIISAALTNEVESMSTENFAENLFRCRKKPDLLSCEWDNLIDQTLLNKRVPYVKAEMYCENIRFRYNSGAKF